MKSDPQGGAVGYDAAKQIKGRKRHLRVDTPGLLLGVHVTPASTPARTGAQELLARVLPWFTWLRILWADGVYTLLACRWGVERTFDWLMRRRRLVRDHETTEASAEDFVLLAMIFRGASKADSYQ